MDTMVDSCSFTRLGHSSNPHSARSPLWIRGLLLLVSLLIGCSGGTQPPVLERGRWIEPGINALYIVYQARLDATEEQLKQILKPRAHELAANHPYVVQVAVYDADWADYLNRADTRQRIMNNELPVGTDLIMHQEMRVQGGLLYIYYRNDDYDDFTYWPRDPG